MKKARLAEEQMMYAPKIAESNASGVGQHFNKDR